MKFATPTSNKPAPFDWDTVKPGMAFHYNNCKVHLVGNDFSDKGRAVVCETLPYGNYPITTGLMFVDKEYLTRAPEHDIKVGE